MPTIALHNSPHQHFICVPAGCLNRHQQALLAMIAEAHGRRLLLACAHNDGRGGYSQGGFLKQINGRYNRA